MQANKREVCCINICGRGKLISDSCNVVMLVNVDWVVPSTAMLQAMPMPASSTTKIPPTLSRLSSLALFFISSCTLQIKARGCPGVPARAGAWSAHVALLPTLFLPPSVLKYVKAARLLQLEDGAGYRDPVGGACTHTLYRRTSRPNCES